MLMARYVFSLYDYSLDRIQNKQYCVHTVLVHYTCYTEQRHQAWMNTWANRNWRYILTVFLIASTQEHLATFS